MEQQLQDSSFMRLSRVNVVGHLERKGQFAYLSWPFAVSELRKVEPTATWEVKRWEGLPYLATDTGYYVEVAVTVAGVTLSQIHPVLDGHNRSLQAPTAFDINSSLQRCLVKAIALHGLGLSVFAGEDLNPPEQEETKPQDTKSAKPKAATQIRQVGSTLTADQQTRITALIKETGADLARLLEYFNVENLADIRATQFDRVIRSLEHKRAA